MSWKIIDEHRQNARNIKFDILIWGPSQNDKYNFSIRTRVRNHLISVGHSAKFSEELIFEGNSVVQRGDEIDAKIPVYDEHGIPSTDVFGQDRISYSLRDLSEEEQAILRTGAASC